MLLIKLALLPFRLAFGTTKLATKTSYRAGRLVGYRRVFVFGAGIAVGLLVAPVTGREVRRRISEMTGTAGPEPLADPDLAERVRNHLRQAPRTWHLPQPVVTEVGPGRIRIDGVVADETAGRDLEGTAMQVPGVDSIDNQIRIGATAETG